MGRSSSPNNRTRNPNYSQRTYVEHTSSRTSANSNKKSGAAPLTEQERLDAILDKISQKGYNSLNAEEKDFLFKASKK